MILTFVEHHNNLVSSFSKQALTFSKKIASQCGTELEAVIVGEKTSEIVSAISEYGPSTLHYVSHSDFKTYSPQTWASTFTQLIEKLKPQALVAAGSLRGNEVLTLVGAKLSLPLSTNSTQVVIKDQWEINRTCWAGNLLELSSFDCETKLITIAPQAIEEVTSKGDISNFSEFSPTLNEGDNQVKLTQIEKPPADDKSLSKATVVVGGGRGVGSKEGFEVLNQLADIIGGVVGGSRVTTNNGWIPHRQQIGLTGTRIAPQLYIACGISGAIQHLSGCKASKNILVINKDPDASFFNNANYGVVGDLLEVLPAVIEEIKKVK